MMNKKINKKLMLLGGAVLAVGIGAIALYAPEPVQNIADEKTAQLAIVSVVLPEKFSAVALTGKRIYTIKCMACHGKDGVGQQGIAPPLIHKIYESSHHGDESFQRAVAMGVHAHHWRFGNMPPIDGLERSNVAHIIRYIREIQRANGIR